MNPLVLLHGALGSSGQLQNLANKLRLQRRKILTLDFSGHGGKSFSKNGFGIEVFADELSQLLDKNKIDQADVFGYSMGGYVAMWLAHKQPNRLGRIVTLGTKFDWDPISTEKELRKLNAEKIQEKVPAFAKALQERHAPTDWRYLLKKTADMMYQLGEAPLLTSDVLRNIKSHVHILLGDQDDMADLNFSKQVASELPFGKFELLPNTPHAIEKVNLELIVERNRFS